MKRFYLFYLTAAIFIVSGSLPVLIFAQSSPDSTEIAGKPNQFDITNINYEIGKIEADFKEYEDGLKPDKELIVIDSIFEQYRVFLEQEAADFRSFNPNNLSKFFLESSYRLWEGYHKKLMNWETQVNAKVVTAQTRINELEHVIEQWTKILNNDFSADLPDEFKDRIRDVVARAETMKGQYLKKARDYVILEDKISETSSFSNDIITDIIQLQKFRQDRLLVSTEPVLWNVHINHNDYDAPWTRLKKFRHENSKTLRNYFETQDFAGVWIMALVLVLLFYLLRRSYLKKEFDDSMPGYKNSMRIFRNQPVLTVIILFFVGFHLASPYYPLLVNYFLVMIVLLTIRHILVDFTGREPRSFIDILLILFALNIIEIVFWYFGDIARLWLLLEGIVGLILLSRFITPSRIREFSGKDLVMKGTMVLAMFSSVLYLVAIIVNIFGFLDLTVLILKVATRVPEFTIVLYGIFKVISTLVVALCMIGKTSSNQMLVVYWAQVEKRSVQLLLALSVIYWFYSFTVSLEVSRVVYDAISNFLTKERSIGTLQITIGSIIALVVILLVTYLLAGLLKVLIENVILKNARLPRGVPAAISVTIRYFLIILGVLFALSAAGIDLGKFSLLAGALGVGIGFGLQNIVNNFISGLILIYERPLNVGDTIEVESLLGQVNRIGIRSSNVKTYDGAEVVVPNGNLISNQLINWTLSDNRRRIEIKVGVAYGSDPNVIVELLEKVAKANEDVLKDPPPWALFEEFGDSSLNFRLLFWVPYDIGIGTKSKVAIGIYNIFKENGVEIPFPQVDLHLKDTPANKKSEPPEA